MNSKARMLAGLTVIAILGFLAYRYVGNRRPPGNRSSDPAIQQDIHRFLSESGIEPLLVDSRQPLPCDRLPEQAVRWANSPSLKLKHCFSVNWKSGKIGFWISGDSNSVIETQDAIRKSVNSNPGASIVLDRLERNILVFVVRNGSEEIRLHTWREPSSHHPLVLFIAIKNN